MQTIQLQYSELRIMFPIHSYNNHNMSQLGDAAKSVSLNIDREKLAVLRLLQLEPLLLPSHLKPMLPILKAIYEAYGGTRVQRHRQYVPIRSLKMHFEMKLPCLFPGSSVK